MRHGDEGFTMIELLIGILVLGSLIAVLAVSLALGLRTTTESGGQINEAAWGRILSNWLVTDIKAAAPAADTVLTGFSGVRGGSDYVCQEVVGGTFVRGFSRPEEPTAVAPTTTLPPVPSTTTTLPPFVIRSYHVDWWMKDGEVIRVSCEFDDVFFPEPSSPPVEATGITIDTVARNLQSFSIDDCSSGTCTVTWVVPASVQAPNRTLENRTYQLTVDRRAG